LQIRDRTIGVQGLRRGRDRLVAKLEFIDQEIDGVPERDRRRQPIVEMQRLERRGAAFAPCALPVVARPHLSAEVERLTGAVDATHEYGAGADGFGEAMCLLKCNLSRTHVERASDQGRIRQARPGTTGDAGGEITGHHRARDAIERRPVRLNRTTSTS